MYMICGLISVRGVALETYIYLYVCILIVTKDGHALSLRESLDRRRIRTETTSYAILCNNVIEFGGWATAGL